MFLVISRSNAGCSGAIYDWSANKNQRQQFPSPQLIGAERQLA